jgi:hypothetical protein
MVCQVDSIFKLNPQLYIGSPIFLDEFNSIVEYLTSCTLDGKRRDVLKMFADIVLNAGKIYCADADLSDMAINFIFDIFKYYDVNIPPSLLYWNKIKNVNIDAIFYKNLQVLESEILKSIKNNLPFVLACDCKVNLDLFVEKCKMFCKDSNIEDRIENFLIYNKDEGNTEDFRHINDTWSNKFVFFTPKIIYGLSFEKQAVDVFGIFYGKSINPLNMMQQLSRCRIIKQLKIYITNRTQPIKYRSIDEINIYNNKIYDDHNKLMKIEKMTTQQLDICYENLSIYYEYYNDILFSYPKYHLQQILKKKGFNIINNNEEDVGEIKFDKKLISDNIKKYNNKNIETIFKSFYTNSIKLTTAQRNKKIKIIDSLKYLNINYQQATNDDYIIELLVNNNEYKHHICLCQAFLKDDILDNNYKSFADCDFKEKIQNNIYSKLKIIRYIENYLKIEPFGIDNLIPIVLESSKIDNFDGNILAQIKNIFGYDNIIRDYDVYKCLVKIYNSVFGNKITENIKTYHIKCNGKNIRLYRYNININYLYQNLKIFKKRIYDHSIIAKNIIKILYAYNEKDGCLFDR